MRKSSGDIGEKFKCVSKVVYCPLLCLPKLPGTRQRKNQMAANLDSRAFQKTHSIIAAFYLKP